MSMLLAALAQAPTLIAHYDCRFLSAEASHSATLSVERTGADAYISMQSDNFPRLSAARQKVVSTYSSGRWPYEVHMASGDMLRMDMYETESELPGYNSAVLLSTEGSGLIGNVAINFGEYYAVGMCQETSREAN